MKTKLDCFFLYKHYLNYAKCISYLTFKTPNSNLVHPVLYSKLKYVSTWVGSIPLMFSPFLIHNVVLNIHGAHFNKPTVRNGLNYHKRNTTGSLQVVLTSFTTLHTIL